MFDSRKRPFVSPGQRTTIQRRWTVSLLITVLAGFLVETALIRSVNEYGSRKTAAGWLHNSTDATLPVLVEHVASALEALAGARAAGPLLAEAVVRADEVAFDVLVQGATGDEHWSALRADGTTGMHTVPLCPPAALAPAIAAGGRAVTLFCSGVPELAVAARVSSGGEDGWLVAERVLGSWWVGALARGAGPEVALVGPDGEITGNATNTAGAHVRVALSPALLSYVAPGAASFYGTGTLVAPSYGGYTRLYNGVTYGLGESLLDVDVAVVPVPGLDSAPVRLVFWVPLDVMRIGARYNTLFLAIGTGLVGLLLLLVAARLSRRLTRPLGALADAAERVTGGDLDVAVPIDGDRETARLGATFADMLRTLREMTIRVAGRNTALTVANDELREAMAQLEVAQGQLVHAGKLAAVGTLVAGLSHELNNPIAVIVGYVQGLLRTTPPGAPAHAGLTAIERQAQRCAGLVRSLLDFSRNRAPHREETPIGALLDRVIALSSAQAKHCGVTLHRSALAADLPSVLVAPDEIASALLNLVSNALDVTANGGQVRLGACLVRTDRGEGVALTVRDHGGGIAADVLPHVFDPFYTTKEPGSGTGLGLPLARRIADAHGGSVELEATSGGTNARLWLPLAAVEAIPVRSPVIGAGAGAAAVAS